MIKKILIPVCLIFVAVSFVSVNEKPITVVIPGSEVQFKLVHIPGGVLKRGGKNFQISAFYLGETEVTYDAFSMFQIKKNDNALTEIKGGKFEVDAVTRPTTQYIDYTFGMGSTGGYPTVSMTQQGALRYCEWLYHKTGIFFRLPTEAEWEYACLMGKDNKNEKNSLAWWSENSENKYHKVAQKAPNSLGLFDMLGNVAEWTLDNYSEDLATQVLEAKDPWIQPDSKHSRTVKGGSYEDGDELCNCLSRTKSSPKWQQRDPNLPKSIWWNTDSPFVGFRLVKPMLQPNELEVKAFFEKAIVL